MVGFQLAWTVPDFRGRQTVFSPEWANAAPLDRAGQIYEQMFAAAAANWYEAGATSFITALFADSAGAAETLFRLGFGMLAMDAMRDLSLPTGEQADVEIRRATVDDLDAVESLEKGLCQHLRAAPVFLLQVERQDSASLAEELADDRVRFLLAIEDGVPVAFIKIGPASDDASTIIRDEGTASITGAYALPNVRGNGVSTALLAHCIEWAHEAGYERCGVDFEPTNIEANRFWRRHFQPVCFGVQRLLNVA
jgi:GNAT superfamily N-acetyltransferase